jgi:hypothetical protein
VTRTIAGSVAALLTAASLFALAGYQVTSAEPATRLLGRLAAALIEIDRWLPAHREDLRLLARDRPAGVVAVRDIPVSATLPAEVVVTGDDAALREALVRSMGTSLYENGAGALRDAEGNPRKPPLTDPLRWAVTLLERDAHQFWRAAVPLFALLLVASVAGGLLFGGQPLAPLAIGAAVSAMLSAAVWLLAQAGEGISKAPVDQEIMLALRDGAWIGLRNAGAVAVALAGLLVLVRSLTGRDRSASAPAWDLPEADIDADRRSY